jgi:hypothetical protein
MRKSFMFTPIQLLSMLFSSPVYNKILKLSFSHVYELY